MKRFSRWLLIKVFTFGNLFYLFACAMVAVTVVMVLAAIFPGFPLPQFLKHSSKDALVIAGIFLALGGHLFSVGHNLYERRYRKSLYYLDSAVEGYQKAYDLLKDGNNNNEIWVAAARAIRDADALAAKVVVGAHRRVLEIHNIAFRRLFHDLLAAQRGAFFYGVWNRALPLDEAEKKSRVTKDSNYVSIELKEESIYTVWKAAQWPNDDPLEGRFSEEERQRPIFSYHYKGLADYLNHKRQSKIL